MIIYFIKDNKRINAIISDSISKKFNLSKENAKTSRNKKNIKQKNVVIFNRKKIEKLKNIKKIDKEKQNNRNKNKNNKNGNKNNPPKKSNDKLNFKDKHCKTNNNTKVLKKKMDSKDSLVIRNLNKDISSKIISLENDKYKKKLNRSNRINSQIFDEHELNYMDYKNAVKYDKRTYSKYYWSLFKKKQLIIFTFLSNNDYNILLIKIDLFLVIFSSYFTINGFFFNDETMHKVYINNGNFSILYQIPQLIFTSAISIILNISLKILALSENDILELKTEKELKKMTEKSKVMKKFIKIKFILFFIISIIILGFFLVFYILLLWYIY